MSLSQSRLGFLCASRPSRAIVLIYAMFDYDDSLATGKDDRGLVIVMVTEDLDEQAARDMVKVGAVTRSGSGSYVAGAQASLATTHAIMGHTVR
jgi:hypothetical protein